MTSKNAETAFARFKNGSNCAQAILVTYGSACGLEGPQLHKLGTGFGAGFARKQYACGAVTAAIAVISLAKGNDAPDDPEKRDEVFRDVFAFIETIEAEFGSVSCRDILGVPITTPEESERAAQAGLIDERCGRVIALVSSGLDELLGEIAITHPRGASLRGAFEESLVVPGTD